ncbi:MAG: PEGA domain-containing protein [Spirochaetes bacterium]|nr:PEGA domain-containing protein [Spirochaetota bacterium]MBU1080258.1 PEGA domain-containing protein [Spirochaetota bacterium]
MRIATSLLGRHAAVAIAIVIATSLSCAIACSRAAPGPAAAPPAAAPSDPVATPAAEEPAAQDPAAEEAPSPAVLAVVAGALAATTEADVAAVESAIAELESAGLLAEAEGSLVAALSEAVAAGRPAPGLHLALAAIYGRKGLAEKAYAAVQSAEAEAKAPGVTFSLAVIYGRKSLLAPSSSGAFRLSVGCDTAGAAASLDGAAPVPVPARFEALRPGRHELTVRLAGYEPFVKVVEGEDGDALAISAALKASPVPLAVTTEPAGASVVVDGLAVGRSPWTGLVAPGAHRVSATMGGRAEASLELSVGVGDSPRTAELRLAPLPATVTVVSEPVGEAVQIWLDGAHVGAAPVTVRIDEPGVHVVKSSSGPERYGPSPEVSFQAVPGESTVVTVRPAALFGYLYIVGDDIDGAFLSVDGLYAGQLPQANTLPLSLEPHKIELQKNGFKTLVRTVNITEAGVSNRVQVKMIADDSAAGASGAPSSAAQAYAVPRRTIKVDGLLDDWAGIAPASGDRANDDRQPSEPGTDIEAAYIAYDDKYLYVMLDFADGRPAQSPKGEVVYALRLIGDTQKNGSRVTFAFHVEYRQGAWMSQVLKADYQNGGPERWSRASEGFPYKFGDGCLEMRIQRRSVEASFKTGETPRVWAYYFTQGNTSATIDDTVYTNFAIAW